jgi:hypothetical protein
VALVAAILVVPRFLGSDRSAVDREQPAAEVAPTPVAPPPGAAEPALVEIRFAVEPADARVEIDGVVASQNPVKLPRSNDAHEVEVSAPGYKSERRIFQALVDGELEFSLERETEPADKPPRRPKRKKPDPRLPDSPL